MPSSQPVGSPLQVVPSILPNAAARNKPYMRGKPNRWQQAFGVFHFYEDGYFQPMTIPIFKHRFVGPTDGKVYDGR